MMQRYSPRYSNFGHPNPDSAGDYVLYAEAQAEINDLKALLAESTRVHEDMKLGGERLASSLKSAKARIEDLEAEIAAMNTSATGAHEEECDHVYRYARQGIWVCRKCEAILED